MDPGLIGHGPHGAHHASILRAVRTGATPLKGIPKAYRKPIGAHRNAYRGYGYRPGPGPAGAIFTGFLPSGPPISARKTAQLSFSCFFSYKIYIFLRFLHFPAISLIFVIFSWKIIKNSYISMIFHEKSLKTHIFWYILTYFHLLSLIFTIFHYISLYFTIFHYIFTIFQYI